jgi:hypothetical protein
VAETARVGLAAAVLIDATVIRAVLLPATMKLLGEANWYLPRRLEWLPTIRGRNQLRSPEISNPPSTLPPERRFAGMSPSPAPYRHALVSSRFLYLIVRRAGGSLASRNGR